MYRANAPLSLPINAEETARIVAARNAGSPLAFDDRKMVEFEPGDIISYVPEQSLLWLLEQGLITVASHVEVIEPKVESNESIF